MEFSDVQILVALLLACYVAGSLASSLCRPKLDSPVISATGSCGEADINRNEISVVQWKKKPERKSDG